MDYRGGWNSVQDYGLGIWWDEESDAIVVMNFRPAEEAVRVDLSGVAATRLTDLRRQSTTAASRTLDVRLPAYGYAVYLAD